MKKLTKSKITAKKSLIGISVFTLIPILLSAQTGKEHAAALAKKLAPPEPVGATKQPATTKALAISKPQAALPKASARIVPTPPIPGALLPPKRKKALEELIDAYAILINKYKSRIAAIQDIAQEADTPEQFDEFVQISLQRYKPSHFLQYLEKCNKLLNDLTNHYSKPFSQYEAQYIKTKLESHLGTGKVPTLPIMSSLFTYSHKEGEPLYFFRSGIDANMVQKLKAIGKFDELIELIEVSKDSVKPFKDKEALVYPKE